MDMTRQGSGAVAFLKLYRLLEMRLMERYAGRDIGPSVVMRYMEDADSEPYRQDLELCRRIRNLLTHNADEDGNPIVEPGTEALEKLYTILRHVESPIMAVDRGTPREKLLTAHPNEPIADIMHAMTNRGLSHVPVLERERVIGVFSAAALFGILERRGLRALSDDARIGELREALRTDRYGAEYYRFMPATATLTAVRGAFENEIERNHRLSAIFITENGTGTEPLLAMLTHWDVLKGTQEE